MNPFFLLFVLFIAVPILELYLLIKVGGIIGAIPTIALVIFTAVLGALLLRVQGFTTLQRAREAMARGELPTVAMLEGLILVVSGVLLLTPGFFTDTLGFLGLIPPVRRALVWWLLRRGLVVPAGAPPTPPGQRHHPETIEGHYTREDD